MRRADVPGRSNSPGHAGLVPVSRATGLGHRCAQRRARAAPLRIEPVGLGGQPSRPATGADRLALKKFLIFIAGHPLQTDTNGLGVRANGLGSGSNGLGTDSNGLGIHANGIL